MLLKKIHIYLFTIFCLISFRLFAQSSFYEKESENFICIYRDSHSGLVEHILQSAENSLKHLSPIFNFTPTGKIIINTIDVSDFGSGSASTVPNNIVRLEIAPFEQGYESLVYDDRIQWMLNHELVHIIVNDQASPTEKFFRSLFSKVPPQQNHPQTTFYSLLTNYSRYTPRWHQEGIAIFLETWLSGGYGRALGSFDEMYFRSLVFENKTFPTLDELEIVFPYKNFMYGKLYYIYGQRFITYLADVYSPQQIVRWYQIDDDEGYQNFESKFETVFGIPFYMGWQNFMESEFRFQRSNLAFLQTSKLTALRSLSNKPYGWITNAYFDSNNNSIIFGYHKPDQLASVAKVNLGSNQAEDIFSIETPSLIQVASTAFCAEKQLFFYTRNNSQLYRDIYMYDLNSKKDHLLFKDCRVGELAVSKTTRQLWGVAHSQGRATLVFSLFPYKELVPAIGFGYGDEIFDLSIDPTEKYLASILHRSDGTQSLILSDFKELKKGGEFQYKVVTSKGSPENPSWSSDGKFIYFNSFISGISNIYKFSIEDGGIIPISNTARGFVKPLSLGGDSLAVFEFSTEGFIPAIIKEQEIERVPAIDYYGQKVFEKYPVVEDWSVSSINNIHKKQLEVQVADYSPIKNLSMLTLVPIVTGFQSEVVLGIYTRFADPLYFHDFTAEVGVSPFGNSNDTRIFLSAKYKYKGKLELSWEYNPPDFYDLFNKRKRGLVGQQIGLGYTGYWVYDNPTKISQKTYLTFYTGMESINDNLVEVSEPNFGVAETVTSYKSLRRSIGSSDYEKGNTFDLTFRGFGTGGKDFAWSGQIVGEWANYSTWIANHNIFRFYSAVGYHYDNERILQSRFYFGGFGNRILENVPVKQYRDVFRFPGLPIYSYDATRFAKISIENNLPPLRIGNASVSQHHLDYIELSLYSQGLWTQIEKTERLFINIGVQLNIVLKHWFNLESTLSFGFGKAWVEKYNNTEYFISFKLLKN